MPVTDRPRFLRVEVRDPLVFPGGRAAVDIEVAGWGRLRVGRHSRWVLRGGLSRWWLPVETPLSVTFSNLFGAARHALYIAATHPRLEGAAPVVPEPVSLDRPAVLLPAALSLAAPAVTLPRTDGIRLPAAAVTLPSPTQVKRP